MNNFANAYAAIVKTDKNDDGTLTVYGKATDDSLDIDQQICDATWLDRAMPEWFKSGGNIREQHSNIAAGVAKEYEAKSDGHYISALVVDPLSVKKVETGVLKGFSIGIKAPRVVRDTKAANGRIVDGQIVEVSLVDRPANPNAKLMLAKSVDGESSLVQVEEMHEYKAPLPSEIAKRKTEKGSKMEQIKQIVKAAKSLSADKVKFDQAAFDTARRALAELIVVEANEMANDGSNEKDSIEELLDAVKHLFNWYEGEIGEGEVAAPALELSTEADAVKEDGCPCDCADCADNKGCDSKMCKCATADKSVSGKCLECGCDKPADAHGRTDVTTAEIVSPDETPKSAEGEADDKPAEEVKADDEVSEDEPVEVLAEEKTLVRDDIAVIIEKAVKSATESVRAEIDSLKTATEAAIEKSVTLEQELAAVKSLPASGPKRTALKQGDASANADALTKAAEYKAKAASATDTVLAKGYREMAKDILESLNQDNSDKE
jgi:hypothetical protein